MGNGEAPTPPVVIETGAHPLAAVIWLHGLGADGHDFEPLVPALRLPPRLPVRFIFPHAPFRPVTWNNGQVMRAWYDIALAERGFRQNARHLGEAVATVHGLIADERRRGIAPGRIVLAGFSQGAAVALHAALPYGDPLAGALCLSAPMPFLDRLLAAASPANAAVPVFLAHGEYDSVVPFALGEKTRARLTEAGLPVEWHAYPADHTLASEEVGDIARWLVARLAGGTG